MTYEYVLEVTAVITTVIQYLCGVLICRNYVSKKSTGDTSGFPFICGFLSCCLWLQYGLLTGELIVAVVNTIGTILMFLYTITYYVFTINKNSYIRVFGGAFALLMTVFLYTQYDENRHRAINIIGYICCIVTVVFFAAPLTSLVHVIRVKNAESLPFPLILASFLVSLQWLIYGVLINDLFIQVPNFLGCVLSGSQLCLFICYPPKSVIGGSYNVLPQEIY